jgi:soluble lytic murein transglycosylase-like protein
MLARATAVGVSAGLLLFGAASAGTVRLTTNADGRKVILNENDEQQSRRFSSRLLEVPREGNVELAPLIALRASQQNLPERLVRAVIQVESGYNARARSNKGAMGLMQLMPETAVELAVSNPYDPDENLRGGTAYLRQMIDRFGRLDMSLAAYNAGLGTVAHYNGIPPYPDTIDYVRSVLALYRGAGGPVQAVAARPRPVAAPRDHVERKPYLFRNSEGRWVVTTALSPSR